MNFALRWVLFRWKFSYHNVVLFNSSYQFVIYHINHTEYASVECKWWDPAHLIVNSQCYSIKIKLTSCNINLIIKDPQTGRSYTIMLKRKFSFDYRDNCENGIILAHSPLQRCFRILRLARMHSSPHHFNQVEVQTLTRSLQHLDSVFFIAILIKICCLASATYLHLNSNFHAMYNKRTFCVLSRLCSVHRFAAALYCDFYADKLKDNISVKALIACSLQ